LPSKYQQVVMKLAPGHMALAHRSNHLLKLLDLEMKPD